MGIIASKKTFADMIGKSPRMVTNYIEDGMPVQGGGGRGKAVEINTEEGINWLIREAVAKAVGLREGDDAPPEGTLEHHKLRKEAAQADQEEIKAARAKKINIHIDDVAQIVFEAASIFAQQSDALADRNASELAAIDDPATIRQKLLDESRRVRVQTAGLLTGFVESLREDAAGSFHRSTSAEEDG